MSGGFADKSRVKDMAREIGIDGIGICDCQPLEETRKAYETAIDRGLIPADSTPRRRTLKKLTTPASHLRGARSVISAYESYFTGAPAPSDPHRGVIAPYTRSNYYEDLRLRLRHLADAIEQDFRCRTKVFSCYVTLAEKPLARRAGLGFYGKNGVIVTPDHGSFVVLGEIITDLELEPDNELDHTCGSCTMCIGSCPTGAIRMPYFIDRSVCLQYLSERRGVIAPAVREVWGNRIYGCSDCQDVCPHNANLSPVRREVTCGAVGASLPLSEVLTMGDAEFETRFADNQIGTRERNTIRRNAILAAGNSRSGNFMAALRECAVDLDPMIRQHSLWAISRIDGTAARPFLRKALAEDHDPIVCTEIKTLLDRLGSLG